MDNHICVPDFEIEADFFVAASTSMSKKSALMEDEMAELLWQEGELVVERSGKKCKAVTVSGDGEAKVLAAQIRSEAEKTARRHVFMQEDELSSWLHYPLDDPQAEPEPAFDHHRDVCNDFLYLAPARESRTSAEEISRGPPPPMPPQARRVDVEGSAKLKNFMHFSRLPRAAPRGTESGPSSSTKAAAVSIQRTSISNVAPSLGRVTMTSGQFAAVRSSPGGASASVEANSETPPPPPPPQQQQSQSATAEDRKRKGREVDDNDNTSVAIDESGETKIHTRGSTSSSKKSRAAEVHNLSERRRRDRINEKMKALQELIPHCNKSDKASMLDEAIEYLKSLQLQVQMMSMGYGMVPMMYPGVQHYMSVMGMGMNRQIVPYPHLLPGSAMPNPSAATHMGQTFPTPAFHVPPVPVPDPSTTQASNASDSMLNSLVTHSMDQSRLPNPLDPYQLYLGQVLSPQNHSIVQHSTSRRVGDPENHRPGG